MNDAEQKRQQDLVITECQTQKDMKRLAGARSICLDAYGADTAGKKYDMEVQREDKGADPTEPDTIPVYWTLKIWTLGRILTNCRRLTRFS